MLRLRRLVMAGIVLFLASLTGCLLSAQQTGERTGDRPVLRIAYGDFHPYGSKGPDGAAQGYNIDVTRKLVQTAGYDAQFIFADNPKQFLDMLSRAEIDLTPFLALTPARRAAGLATSSIGQYALSVYVRRDIGVTSIAALSGKRVGAVTGSVNHAVAARIPFVEIVEFQTSDALLLPLLSGEVDAVVGVAETFEARLRINYIEDKVRKLRPALTVIPYGIIVRSDLPQVHVALERAIAQTATPQALEPLRAHWFGTDRSILVHPWFGNVAMIIGGIVWATLALGIYAVRLRRRSARQLVKHGANTLLIDALDKMRAAIVIFDADMRAVHWNKGFEARFPELVRAMGAGATIEQTCVQAYQHKILQSQMDVQEIKAFSRQTVQRLKQGETVQRIVQTPFGNTFDLSIFSMGARNYAAIWVDVTELNRQQEHIAAQSAELMRKNQQLLAFSAMAAHDLKAPLLQQTALVEFILEDIEEAHLVLPTEVQDHFATLTDLSRRMNLLVQDLLEYAQADICHAPRGSFLPNARLDGVLKLAGLDPRMEIVVMPDMPAVQVEPTSFDMVMRNLVANAAKHHDRPSGRITLRAYQHQDEVCIEVEDDGPGIEQAQHARVFEPFARLTKVEGSGLGLAFVKKTVTAWGGRISLRAAPNRGVIVTVTLPALRDSAPKDNVIALPNGTGHPIEPGFGKAADLS